VKLNWIENEFAGRDALLGNFAEDDGVRFNLLHYPTCYRRGPWRLLIEVEDRNRTWGGFDDQDQPMRWFHSEQRALEEAQAIADVLIADHVRKAQKMEKKS
jgi:hypothetical protein